MAPACELTILEAGWTTHRERRVVAGGRRGHVAFPALVGLVRHPTAGIVLFDTGYSERVPAAMKRFPMSVLAGLLPVHIPAERALVRQLSRLGIEPGDVRTVVLSHFHADHIGAAADFPAARFVFLAEAYDAVRSRGAFGRLRAGFLPEVLPVDFGSRSEGVPRSNLGTESGALAALGGVHDLLGDGSLLLLALPGHARGQAGLLVQTDTGPVLLAADACYHSATVTEGRRPGGLLRLVVDDWTEYLTTIDSLSAAMRACSELTLVPSHCGAAYRRFVPGAAETLGGVPVNGGREGAQ